MKKEKNNFDFETKSAKKPNLTLLSKPFTPYRLREQAYHGVGMPKRMYKAVQKHCKNWNISLGLYGYFCIARCMIKDANLPKMYIDNIGPIIREIFERNQYAGKYKKVMKTRLDSTWLEDEESPNDIKIEETEETETEESEEIDLLDFL